MTIYPHKSYLRAFKKFSGPEQKEINAAIARLPEIIANPHQHSGAGVRRLRQSVFEIHRLGMQLFSPPIEIIAPGLAPPAQS